MITNKKKTDWKVEGRTEVKAWTQTMTWTWRIIGWEG